MVDKYEAMLPRLAEHARQHPRLYHAQVAALGMLGYGVVVGLLVFLVGVAALLVFASFQPGGMGALQFIVPLVVFIGILVEALWIQIEPPRGVALSRREAPALWAEIDRVCSETGGPAPHQVLIDQQLNASVAQVPRLGVLGFYRTYLTIGLPLAASLTPDEFRAVLAHEYGHVAGAHGRLGVWIYRVLATWTRMLDELADRRHWALIAFRPFVRWYVPFLEAYTAVLRREHEFQADRVAALSAGVEATASGLCRLSVAERFGAEVFWPGVAEGVRTHPVAPADIFRRLLEQAPAAARHPDAARWLREAAERATEPWDSHPSLADRLAATGAEAALPDHPASPSAAEVFLGDAAPRLADRLGRRWADAAQFSWRADHDEHLRLAAELAALESRAGEQPLPPEQARQRILLTVQLHGGTVAMPLMREFLDAGEDDASVQLLLGQQLVQAGDEAGLRHLERAMEMDPDTTIPACQLAAVFLNARGRAEEAETFVQRGQEFIATALRAGEERDGSKLSHDDEFLPHGLDEAETQRISTILSTVRGLKRALLVRKAVTIRPDTPCFVLAVEPVWKPGEMEGGHNPSDQLAERVFRSVGLPGTVIMVTFVQKGWALEKVIEQVPGAVLYSRAAPARAGAR